MTPSTLAGLLVFVVVALSSADFAINDFGQESTVQLVGDAILANGACYSFDVRSDMELTCLLPPLSTDPFSNIHPRELLRQVPVCPEHWLDLCAQSCDKLLGEVEAAQRACRENGARACDPQQTISQTMRTFDTTGEDFIAGAHGQLWTNTTTHDSVAAALFRRGFTGTCLPVDASGLDPVLQQSIADIQQALGSLCKGPPFMWECAGRCMAMEAEIMSQFLARSQQQGVDPWVPVIDLLPPSLPLRKAYGVYQAGESTQCAKHWHPSG